MNNIFSNMYSKLDHWIKQFKSLTHWFSHHGACTYVQQCMMNHLISHQIFFTQSLCAVG